MVPDSYWVKGFALRRHSRASGIMDLRHTRLPAPGDLGRAVSGGSGTGRPKPCADTVAPDDTL